MAKKNSPPAKAQHKAKTAPSIAPKSIAAAPNRKHPPAKQAPKVEVKKETKPTQSAAAAKASAKDDLRSRILARSKISKPIAFSLDEAKEIAKVITAKQEADAQHNKALAKNGNNVKKADLSAANDKPAQPHHVKAASLADILGFNPTKKKTTLAEDEDESIPERFRRFYRLLIDLRDHVTGQLDRHTEETLKRSAKDDAGDLSSYGQHMADAGTDTFDRDFALSLVSNEQEALSEIDAAIQRIKSGTYGICEVTAKPIARERLLAVPFTRFSAEAQKEIERNRYRGRQQAGLFGELGEDGAKIAEDDGGED